TAARDSLGETSVPVTDAGTEESASPATPGTDTDSSGDTSQGTGTAEQTGLVRVDTRRPSDKGIIILLLVLVVICLAAGLIALAAAKRKR
ncbi:MAG: hypothetical protein J5830_01445, partial [Clostridia bacterium]|nr:hypothetical protein [Clostridia bacterium]